MLLVPLSTIVEVEVEGGAVVEWRLVLPLFPLSDMVEDDARCCVLGTRSSCRVMDCPSSMLSSRVSDSPEVEPGLEGVVTRLSESGAMSMLAVCTIEQRAYSVAISGCLGMPSSVQSTATRPGRYCPTACPESGQPVLAVGVTQPASDLMMSVLLMPYHPASIYLASYGCSRVS